MQFFMDTTQGRDTFNAVAELAKSGLGEWSYGFDVLDAQPGVFDGKDVRVLTGLKVFEVSPVLVGAGVNTRTLSVKSASGKSDAGRAAYNAAIRPHTTATDNGDWNATKVKSAIPGNASIADLRSVYAWHSPDGDPEAKSSYKFAHHDGVDGAANIRACITGIAILNGAIGGTGIPDADRRGVYNHLASHLEDAKRAVPELRADLSPSSLKFADECAAVLASVSSLRERAEEVHTLRASKGRTMSSASVEMLEWLDGELRRLKALIDTPQEDMAREYMRFTLTNMIGNRNA
nr:HK97 family phage prohead protease [Streptomyces sp. SID3212]